MEDKKRKERAVVELAAALLREEWDLRASESPDFIVTTPDGQFGLEVTTCHAGITTKKGSVAAKAAQWRQQIMNEIRAEAIDKHPQVAEWAVSVFKQWTDRDSVKKAIMAAIEEEIGDATKTHQEELLQENIVTPSLSNFPSVLLSRHEGAPVTRVWRFMPDHAGDMDISSAPLQAAIDAKASKIEVYRQQCKDVRLLVSAFSLEASGNVSITSGHQPNLRGFNEVYFMRIPQYVVRFPSGTVAALTSQRPSSLSEGATFVAAAEYLETDGQ